MTDREPEQEPRTMKLSSDYAILDVKDGRHELAAHFATRPALGTCPENLRIPVTIEGYIDAQTGADDGTSIEFGVQITGFRYKIPNQPYNISEDIEDYIKGTVGIVEANSFEYHCLWKEARGNRDWVERGHGYGPVVGYSAGGNPVALSLRSARIDGHGILFIEPTSAVVDHDLIKSWLSKHLPGVKKVDAQNFHNVFPA